MYNKFMRIVESIMAIGGLIMSFDRVIKMFLRKLERQE